MHIECFRKVQRLAILKIVGRYWRVILQYFLIGIKNSSSSGATKQRLPLGEDPARTACHAAWTMPRLRAEGLGGCQVGEKGLGRLVGFQPSAWKPQKMWTHYGWFPVVTTSCYFQSELRWWPPKLNTVFFETDSKPCILVTEVQMWQGINNWELNPHLG